MRVVLAASLGAVLVAGCALAPPSTEPTPATAEAIAAETERINAWFEARYEEQLRFSPITLTFLGRKELYDQLDDLSIAAEDEQLAWHKASVEQMQAEFDYALLSDEAKRSYDIWKQQYERAAAGVPFRANQYVFQQMNGMQAFLPTFLINFHRVDTEADVEAYIARIGEVQRVFEQLLVRAQGSARLGIRPPRFAYEGVIEQARKVITGAPFTQGDDSAIWADLKAKIDALAGKKLIDAQRAQALKEQGRAQLLARFEPAYEKLIAWIESDLPNAAVNPVGVSTHPNGKAYYDYRLKLMTTTDLTADQIHELGLAEVARLRGEMIALKQRVGFDGDLQAFFEFISTDPRFKFPNTDEGRQAYIDAATAAIDNIKKELPNWFGLLPKADLVVKRVEAFREQDGAAQHYYPGTPDGSRPGIYYAHLSDMNAMPIPELEVIAYHEGLPGHHMQISIAQELQGVPKFRTQADFTAYIEGWALYAEWLARQMPGTYQDPYSDYGRLSSEMWRAVRLVVDTGLHAKGWTEQQAIEYFAANTAIPAAAQSEVRRYLVIPGQATAYKIGMIKIQELRARAEAELGERFDIRGFHDAVLGGGALPLNLLEQRIEQWIAERKAA
ncbi:DUF885 domain-containing protein [Sinimarinibacterium thermocellulolyticum]|uniref:DUF885 domain-containing protein n=1 Tax=Sinimarinibacterium thermocellulolyticum TaxID=3170016 RepID=A0ABV2A965_9GAMM